MGAGLIDLGAVAVAATQVLGGRYRLIERLGRGGMSVVWHAYDEALGRPVAIKLLTASHLDHAASRGRILAEAQAAARLSHPHITSVFDYGEAATEPGGQMPYVVMELLSGSTLAEQLRTGPLPVRTALQVCAQVAGALAAAHRSGVVHRDVKPANVMLTPAGAKVLDFGLAAAAGASEEFRAGGELWGTPAYLAPERLTAGEVMPASDVYALGILLYAALTGRRPWPAETARQLLHAHRYEPPEPLPLIAGLPNDVAALCHRCLAKEARYRPTAAELARVLAKAVGWRVSSAAPAWPLTPPVRIAVPQIRAAAEQLDEFPTGPTVVHGRRTRAGATHWRTLALSGSAAAVLAAVLTGLLGATPGPGGQGAHADTAGGKPGTAIEVRSPAGEFDAGEPARQPGQPDRSAGTTTDTGGVGGSGPSVSASPSDLPTSPPPSSDPPPATSQPTDPTTDPPATEPPDTEPPDPDPGSGTTRPDETPEQPEQTSEPAQEQEQDQQESAAEQTGTP